MASEPGRELASIDFESMLGGPLRAVVNAQAQAAMSSVNFIKSVGFKPGNVEDPTKAETGEPIYVAFKYPKELAPFQPAEPAAITEITVDDGGLGYTDPPDVTFSGGGGGSGLTATAVIDGAGTVSAINITDPGSGYSSAPTVSVANVTGTGTQRASATAVFTAATAPVAAVFQEMKIEVPILTMLPIPFIRIEETTIDFNAKINSVEEVKTDETFKFKADLEVKGQYPPLFSMVSAKLNVSTSYQKNTQTGSKVDRTYSMAVHIRAVQDEMPAGMERILGILEDAIAAQPSKAPTPIEA